MTPAFRPTRRGSRLRLLCLATVLSAGILPGLPHAAGQTDDKAELHVTRSRLAVDPALSRAYAALAADDLAAAEAGYARVLKSDPGNADALHGAAVVALRRNRRDHAEALFGRAIVADPNDAVAQAGIAGLRPIDPAIAESRLKQLIASQPDQHCLHFALGNAYAAAARWRDAFQAFSRAHGAAPDQPDYLFNLAVSLDRLHQIAPARRFYQQALAAAERHPAAFDPALATLRLRELSP